MTDKFIVVKREKESKKSKKHFQTIYTITAKDNKELSKDMVKDLSEKYAALGKTFTIQAITTRDVYTTLKAKRKMEIIDYDDDYFKSNAGENKRSHNETYKSIIITVAEGVKKKVIKNKKTF